MEATEKVLRRHLDRMNEYWRAATGHLCAMEEGNRDLAARTADLDREAETLRAENEALEERLEGALRQDAKPIGAVSCSRSDLCGRCILYVGGRPTQLSHLQRLVSERNGVLVHHDGGVEESIVRLHGLLGSADAVVFPVDNVSHSAHDQLKSLCRRCSKPFLPIRSAGLGAFIKALDAVAAPDPN